MIHDRLRRCVGLPATVVCLLLAAASAHAQNGDDDDDIPNEVGGGVYIDAEGMVRMRQRDAATTARLARQRLASAQKAGDAKLVYISLPRSFAEAKRLTDAGLPLPDDLRLLGGMTKLRYMFVFPDERDLVIAGLREPIVGANTPRPVGKFTGRPVLQLDDLVVALRMYGPGAAPPGAFGCSIDMPAGAMDAVRKAMDAKRSSRTDRMDELAKAVGPQTVRLFGVAGDTRFGATCVEADYALKRMAIGVDPSPVPSVRYNVGEGGEQFTRWWFTASEAPVLAASPDGLAFELTGPTLKLVTSPDANSRGSNPAAELYAERFTAALPQFAAATPELADLWNLSDLALLASLIRADRLHDRVGWNVGAIADGPAAFKVASVTVPRTADTVVNYRNGSYAIGGVSIDPAAMTDRARRGESADAAAKASRPDGDAWFKAD